MTQRRMNNKDQTQAPERTPILSTHARTHTHSLSHTRAKTVTEKPPLDRKSLFNRNAVNNYGKIRQLCASTRTRIEQGCHHSSTGRDVMGTGKIRQRQDEYIKHGGKRRIPYVAVVCFLAERTTPSYAILHKKQFHTFRSTLIR